MYAIDLQSSDSVYPLSNDIFVVKSRVRYRSLLRRSVRSNDARMLRLVLHLSHFIPFYIDPCIGFSVATSLSVLFVT